VAVSLKVLFKTCAHKQPGNNGIVKFIENIVAVPRYGLVYLHAVLFVLGPAPIILMSAPVAYQHVEEAGTQVIAGINVAIVVEKAIAQHRAGALDVLRTT